MWNVQIITLTIRCKEKNGFTDDVCGRFHKINIKSDLERITRVIFRFISSCTHTYTRREQYY